MDVDTLLELIPLLNRDCISIIESYIDRFRFKLSCKNILDDCIKDVLLLEDNRIAYLAEDDTLKIINTTGELLITSKSLQNDFIRPRLLPLDGNRFIIPYYSMTGKNGVKYIDNNYKENNISVSNDYILDTDSIINIKSNKLIIKYYNNTSREIKFRENIFLYVYIGSGKIALYFEQSSKICIYSLYDKNISTYVDINYRVTHMIANKDILICYSHSFAIIYYLDNTKSIRINNLDTNILDIVNGKLVLISAKNISILNLNLSINKQIDYINPIRIQSILDDNTIIALDNNNLLLDEKEISLGNKDIFTTLGNKILICRDRKTLELYN